MFSVAKLGKTLLFIIAVCMLLFAWHKLSMPNDNAVIAKTNHDLERLNRSMQQYIEHDHNLPSNKEGLIVLVDSKVIEKLPKDPWGNLYRYEIENVGGKYRIFTFGRDNTMGGEGLDSDRYVSGALGKMKE